MFYQFFKDLLSEISEIFAKHIESNLFKCQIIFIITAFVFLTIHSLSINFNSDALYHSIKTLNPEYETEFINEKIEKGTKLIENKLRFQGKFITEEKYYNHLLSFLEKASSMGNGYLAINIINIIEKYELFKKYHSPKYYELYLKNIIYDASSFDQTNIVEYTNQILNFINSDCNKNCNFYSSKISDLGENYFNAKLSYEKNPLFQNISFKEYQEDNIKSLQTSVLKNSDLADKAFLIAIYFRKLGYEFLHTSKYFLSMSYNFYLLQYGNFDVLHENLINIATLLGITNIEIGDYKNAEYYLLQAFHWQEKLKGSNDPLLSFNMKLIVEIYEAQNRTTEAEAIKNHINRLLNKTNISKIENENKPEDLVNISSYGIDFAKANYTEESFIRAFWVNKVVDNKVKKIALFPTNLAKLINICEEESGQKIELRSGYRSVHTQKTIYNKIGYKGTVAKPGYSEHHTGLAVDINVDGDFMQESDQAYQCFEKNSHKYGLVLSYPPGNNYLPAKKTFEPWHWLFIGEYAAQLYKSLGDTNRPKEFLYAFPCYSELAKSNLIDLDFYDKKKKIMVNINQICSNSDYSYNELLNNVVFSGKN